MKKNRAFLKWAGGKYPLLDDIKKHLPKGECLIEPFVGAGSVFLNTDFSRYILADINSDLISLYNIVKLRTAAFIEEARKLFSASGNTGGHLLPLSVRRSTPARIPISAPCCSSISTAMVTTACAGIICAGNLTCRLAAISARISRRTSCITLPKKQAQKAISFVCEHRTMLLWATPLQARWCIAIRLTRRCRRRRISPLTTPTASASPSSSAWRNWRSKLAQESRIPVLISNHDTLLTREWYQHAKHLHVVKARRTISRAYAAARKRWTNCWRFIAAEPVSSATNASRQLRLAHNVGRSG